MSPRHIILPSSCGHGSFENVQPRFCGAGPIDSYLAGGPDPNTDDVKSGAWLTEMSSDRIPSK